MTRDVVNANRRRFLKYTGAATATGMVGLAGCSGNNQGGDQGSSPEGNQETTQSGDQEATENQQETQELEVLSYNVGTAALPATMIQELGADADHNLNVNFEFRGDLGQMYRDFVLDKVSTLAAAGPATVASSRNEGKPVKYLSPVNQNHTTLITRPDAPYESLEDLQGKKIGWFGLPSEASLGLLLIAKLKGFDLRNDFQLKRGGPSTLLGLTQKGDLDAAIYLEPDLSAQLANDNVKTVMDPFYKVWEEETGFELMPVGGIGTHESTIQENRKGLESFVSAKNDVLEQFTSNPKQWLTEDWMQEVTGLEDEAAIDVASERLKGTYNYTWGEQGKASVEFYLNQAAQTEMIDEVPDDLFEAMGP